MHTKTLKYKDLLIHHTINKKLKHGYIKIDKNGKIELKTPTARLLDEILYKKEFWIKKHLAKLEKAKKPEPKLGEELLLFGEVLRVDEVQNLAQSLAKAKSESGMVRAYDNFYKEQSTLYLPQRLEYFSFLMGVGFSELRFKKLKSRWGSCSSKGVITLNVKLLKLEKKLIDYVVVHELAHLVHFNHSRSFYELVQRYLPNYKELQKELAKTQM